MRKPYETATCCIKNLVTQTCYDHPSPPSSQAGPKSQQENQALDQLGACRSEAQIQDLMYALLSHLRWMKWSRMKENGWQSVNT